MHITTLPAFEWEPCGDESDPRARLLAAASIGGALLHVDAIAVDSDGEPIPESYYSREDFDALFCVVGADKGWQTATIEGREYVILATPFCR